MGNTQYMFPLDHVGGQDVISASDTTLISNVGPVKTGEHVTDRPNDTTQKNNEFVQKLRSASNEEPFHQHEQQRKTECRFSGRQYCGPTVDITSQNQNEFQGSPIPFSEPSTDGESGVSDTYKTLIKRDYLGLRNGMNSSINLTPSRVVRPLPIDSNDISYICAIDVNLDYTIHVGKLAIYVKQIRFNISRMEEILVDGCRIRGRIKCYLLNKSKGQRNSSNVFEASKINRKIVYTNLDDSFVFYLFPKNDIPLMSLIFKVTVSKTLFREFNLGESVIKLADFDLNAEMLPMTVTFGETVTKEKDTNYNLQAIVLPKSEKLEILLSLEYNADTGKLIVNIGQTTKLDELRYESKREIIFQAELLSPACKCVQRKTTFLKLSEDNPGSNKPFQFDVPQEDLCLNTLMLSVSYSATRWLQQEKIGWIAFGRNCSGQVEAEHWDLMISQSLLHEPAVQWHCLCESPELNKSHTLLTRVFK